jgi:hypothetical protein
VGQATLPRVEAFEDACRLTDVSRAVAGWLLCALVALWTPALPRHVHAAADHSHAEHQHGLATHTHDDTHAQASERHDEAEAPEQPHMEACPPDAHTIDAVLTTAAMAGKASPSVTAVSVMRLPAPAATHAAQPSRTDVRVHGPPAALLTSPRAPPRLHPA